MLTLLNDPSPPSMFDRPTKVPWAYFFLLCFFLLCGAEGERTQLLVDLVDGSNTPVQHVRAQCFVKKI